MKGEVEKVWKNETEDGRRYEVFQIGGERYSLWDEDYLDRIQEGQSLEFDFKESGDFKNITEIYEPSKNEEKEPEYGNQRLKKTIRMSSLKSASRVLIGSKIPYQNRAEKAIEIAKKFEKYIDDDGLDVDGE
ncbi:MAG: hypothetical protein KAW52_09080 [candidate division Zixibacteria bacterium]|nr:hypothetical protein [candidate division Zixibacteria bacterium]